MKKDILNEPLYRERSYIKSLVAGIRLPLRHPLGFLRHLWPLMVLYVAVWAVVSRWMAPHLWQLVSVLSEPCIPSSSLIGLPLLYVMGWGLLAVVLFCIEAGQLNFLMLRYGTLSYFPAVHPWQVWRSVQPHVLRSLAVGLVFYVVWCLLALLSLWLIPSRLWALAAFAILSLVWILVSTSISQQYLLSGLRVPACLSTAFRGHSVTTEAGTLTRYPSRMAGNASILVVSGLTVFLVVLVGLLPSVCTLYVGAISDHAVAIGDATDLPASFQWLRAGSFALSALVAFLSLPFLFVPLIFHWGAERG